jgi:hypothetical protein
LQPSGAHYYDDFYQEDCWECNRADGSLIAAASTDGTITLWPTMLPDASPGASTSADRARLALEAGEFFGER